MFLFLFFSLFYGLLSEINVMCVCVCVCVCVTAVQKTLISNYTKSEQYGLVGSVLVTLIEV